MIPHEEITVGQLSEVLGSEQEDKIVTVKIGAPWCGACEIYNAEIPTLIDEFQGRVRFVHVNIDTVPDGQQEARDFKRKVGGYENIPTILVFRGGEQKEKLVGRNMNNLRKAIQRVLG